MAVLAADASKWMIEQAREQIARKTGQEVKKSRVLTSDRENPSSSFVFPVEIQDMGMSLAPSIDLENWDKTIEETESGDGILENDGVDEAWVESLFPSDSNEQAVEIHMQDSTVPTASDGMYSLSNELLSDNDTFDFPGLEAFHHKVSPTDVDAFFQSG